MQQTKERPQTSNTPSEEVEELPSPDVSESKELVAQTAQLEDDIDRILAEVKVEGLRPLHEDTPYTLADAMREGSSLTPQAVGAWTTPQGETCALSAAALAIRARGLS